MPHRALRRHDQRALGAHADADEIAGVHGIASCPGRAAAFFTLLRRAGTVPNTGVRNGPGSAAHRSARLRAALRPGNASPLLALHRLALDEGFAALHLVGERRFVDLD